MNQRPPHRLNRSLLLAAFATALLSLLPTAALFANQYIFSTNPPVAGASVYVDGTPFGLTDENGKAVLSGVSPGVHLLRVDSGGESYVGELKFEAELNALPPFNLDARTHVPKPQAREIDYTINTNLAGLTVSVDGVAQAVTDNDGRALVHLTAGQAHTIDVRKAGFDPHVETVTPTAAGQLDVVLQQHVEPPRGGGGVDVLMVVLILLLVASVTLLLVMLVRHRARAARAAAAVPRTPVLPEQNIGHFDRYRLISTLGSGGVATIYRAHDLVEKAGVALKVLDARWLTDPDMVRKFLTEGEALQSITQGDPAAAVVKCFRFGREHGSIVGRPFIALELLEGETLQSRLDRDPVVQPMSAVALAYQIATALVAVHRVGIVHRDLTPDNIFLRNADFFLREERYPVPSIVLIDFGIARQELMTRMTLDGSIAGKPHYMSPEQCRGLAVDARSDLYSLGIILYEMAAGRLPFAGRDPFEVMRAQMSDEPPRLGAHVPEQYAELCHQLLRKEPEGRPQSAAAVAYELEQVLVSLATPTSMNVVSFPTRRVSL